MEKPEITMQEFMERKISEMNDAYKRLGLEQSKEKVIMADDQHMIALTADKKIYCLYCVRPISTSEIDAFAVRIFINKDNAVAAFKALTVIY